MIARVYIAAPYQLKEQADEVRALLNMSSPSIFVTSRWIDGPFKITNEEAGDMDLADVRSAEALVLINPKKWANSGTGGRHTEVGYALCLGLPIFVLGEPTNLFHAQQLVRVVDTTNELVAVLQSNLPTARKNQMTYGEMLDALIGYTHAANKKWWVDIETGQPITRNFGELLMLVTSELAEALEGDRKDLMDDKLPQFRMKTVEIADALIRLFDIAGGLALDVPDAFEKKMEYNSVRVDHSHAHRLSEHGKKY